HPTTGGRFTRGLRALHTSQRAALVASSPGPQTWPSNSKEDAMTLRLATATALVLVGAAAPGSASPSAYGAQYWGLFTVNIKGQSIGIPSGQLVHDIEGSGTHIRSEWAHITTGPGFCNWRVDYVYRTVNNRVYRRIRTATQFGCDTWAYAPTVYPGHVRRGTA